MNHEAEKNNRKEINRNVVKQNAINSANHYFAQLKLHFELSDKELTEVIEKIYKTQKKSIYIKKWWNLWT